MRAAADKVFAIPASFGGYRSNPGPEMTDFERSLELMRQRGEVYEPTPFDSTSGSRGGAKKAVMSAQFRARMKEMNRKRMEEMYGRVMSNPAERTMLAKRNGTCPLSGEFISVGDSITKTNAGWVLSHHAGRA